MREPTTGVAGSHLFLRGPIGLHAPDLHGAGPIGVEVDDLPVGRNLRVVVDALGRSEACFFAPASGGEETRLTTAKGVNDNPEFSPDGKIVYFNSDRSGSMQIWRMQADGTAQEQVTSGDASSWFPHLSPNGRQLVFLSLAK